jgi:site-specific DNA-methyltransferase (adenine-specific)
MSGFRQKNGVVTKKIVKTEGKFKDVSNVWSMPVGFKNLGHPAVFPEQLATDHILSWSNENDIILDPMCGSGTTCKMAKMHNRNYIGIEISQKYCNIANERINNIPDKLFKD